MANVSALPAATHEATRRSQPPHEDRDGEGDPEHEEQPRVGRLDDPAVEREPGDDPEADGAQRGIQDPAVLQAGGQRGERDRTGDADEYDEGQPERGLAPPADLVEVEQRGEDEHPRPATGDETALGVAAHDRAQREPGQRGDADRRRQRHGRLGDPLVEPDRAVLLEQHRHPEDREREEQERGEGHRVVEAGVLPDRRQDPQCDADDDGQQGRQRHQAQRRPRGVGQGGADGGAAGVRAEVAVEGEAPSDTGQPHPVALVPGQVEVHRPDPGRHELVTVAVPALPQVLQRVTRVHREQVEQDRAEQQDQCRDPHAAQDESDHGPSFQPPGPVHGASSRRHSRPGFSLLPCPRRRPRTRGAGTGVR
jgi:hypothetical protein